MSVWTSVADDTRVCSMILLRHSSIQGPLGASKTCRPLLWSRGRLHAWRAQATKGFGPPKPNEDDESSGGRRLKPRKANVQKPDPGLIPYQGQVNSELIRVAQLEQSLLSQKDEDDFSKRLEVLRTEGIERQKAETKSSSPAIESSDFYANPPKLTDTLMKQLNADVSDPKLKTAEIGPNQIAIAASAVVFGLVFLLVSGADFTTSRRYQGVRPAQAPPDALEAALIKGRMAQLQNALEMNQKDTDALEELAVSYAQMFEFEKAAETLDKLVINSPNNAEVYRLLGETTLLAQQPSRSVAAYEKAAALLSSDLQVLTGLADAYIASAQQEKAVRYLTKLKSTYETQNGMDLGMKASATGKEKESVNQQKGPGSSGPATLDGSADIASLDLLLAKVYSSWRGHDRDALATYDGLIKNRPDDFRGYLAKGLFLKERGQKADAQRMFLQVTDYLETDTIV